MLPRVWEYASAVARARACVCVCVRPFVRAFLGGWVSVSWARARAGGRVSSRDETSDGCQLLCRCSAARFHRQFLCCEGLISCGALLLIDASACGRPDHLWLAGNMSHGGRQATGLHSVGLSSVVRSVQRLGPSDMSTIYGEEDPLGVFPQIQLLGKTSPKPFRLRCDFEHLRSSNGARPFAEVHLTPRPLPPVGLFGHCRVEAARTWGCPFRRSF